MATSTELGTAYVRIVPSAQGISGAIKSEIMPEATSAGEEAGTAVSKSMGQRIQAAGKTMIKAGTIATAISVPVIKGLKSAFEAYEVQNTAESKLTEIYKTRMGAGKAAAKSTMDLASALQKEGIIGDEVALSGAQQLATFAKMPSTIDTLLPAMENLLAQQKGVNASTEDATNVGNLMGKVLQGQTGALKRVGVTFSDAQEKVLKYGTEEEKAAVLSDVITQNVGNMNSTLADTPAGKVQQLKNSLGDLKEALGAGFADALGGIASTLEGKVIPKLETFFNLIKDNPIVGKIILGIAALLAVGGPLLILIGSLITSFTVVSGAIAAVSVSILPVVAVIAALALGFIYAYKHSETFRNAINQCAGIIKGSASKAFTELKKDIGYVVTAFKEFWGVISPYVLPILRKLVSLMPTLLTILLKVGRVGLLPLRAAFTAVVTTIHIFTAATRGIVSAVSTMVGRVKSTVSKVTSAFSAPFTKAYKSVKGIVDRIKGIFPLSFGKIMNLKLPHISVSGGKAPYGIGGLGKLPKFSVKWAAQGMILDGATIIGAGEAGREGIIPLEGRYMRPFAAAIAGEMSGNGTTQYNTFNITVDGTESPEIFADRLVRRLQVQLRTA